MRKPGKAVFPGRMGRGTEFPLSAGEHFLPESWGIINGIIIIRLVIVQNLLPVAFVVFSGQQVFPTEHSLQKQGIDLGMIVDVVPVIVQISDGFVIRIEGVEADIFRFQKKFGGQPEGFNLGDQISPLAMIVPVDNAVGWKEAKKLNLRIVVG